MANSIEFQAAFQFHDGKNAQPNDNTFSYGRWVLDHKKWHYELELVRREVLTINEKSKSKQEKNEKTQK